MKRIKELMLAAAGMLFFSCTADDDVNKLVNTLEDGDAASMVLKLSNETVSGTRALDDLQPNGIQSILQVKGTVNIFFFTATGKLVHGDTPNVSELSTGKKYTNEDHGITTAVKEVVVVGNVGNILSGVTNKKSLHQKLNTLENAQSDYIKSSPDIWVYGSSTDIDWNASPAVNGVMQGSCTLDVAPVLSRIDVTVNTSGITAGYEPSDIPSSNVDFKGVAVLYSGGYTHYIPEFIPTTSEITAQYGSAAVPLRSGLTDNSFPLWTGTNQTTLLTPTVNDESILNASWLGQWNSNDNFDSPSGTFSRSFYAFPSKTQSGFYNRNTVVTVYGDFHDNPGESDDKITPLFWAVHFSPTQLLNGSTFATTLENGKVYNLTINLKGDYSEGGPGTTDPDGESNPADITVTINQAKWKAIISMKIDFDS